MCSLIQQKSQARLHATQIVCQLRANYVLINYVRINSLQIILRNFNLLLIKTSHKQVKVRRAPLPES